jgi:hypothetical protein
MALLYPVGLGPRAASAPLDAPKPAPQARVALPAGYNLGINKIDL